MEQGQGKPCGEGHDVLSELQLFQNPAALVHLHFTRFEEASEFRADSGEATLEERAAPIPAHINPLSPIHPLGRSSPI